MLLSFLNFMLEILKNAFTVDFFVIALGFVVVILVLRFIYKMSSGRG